MDPGTWGTWDTQMGPGTHSAIPTIPDDSEDTRHNAVPEPHQRAKERG